MSLKKQYNKKQIKKMNNIKKPLLKIRKKIDKIDGKMHDLVMERAELVLQVIKEKEKVSKENLVIYRPAREHEILVRLIKRHKGKISLKALIFLWRNLISIYISIQGELKLSFAGQIDDAVRSHFGSEIKINKVRHNISCLKVLSENKAHIIVLPYPNKINDWWSRLDSFQGVSIIGGISKKFNGKTTALILSKQDIEYSSKNTALYVLKINAKIVNAYCKFIASKGYDLICKKNISSDIAMILFSTDVESEAEEKNKLLELNNFELNNNLKPKNIGIFAVLNKDILYE